MEENNNAKKKGIDVEISTRKLQTFTRKLSNKGKPLAEELLETTVKTPITIPVKTSEVKDKE